MHLIKIKTQDRNFFFVNELHINKPVSQSCPVHPAEQSQEYEPSLLMQVPLFWHGDTSHSFLSTKTFKSSDKNL